MGTGLLVGEHGVILPEDTRRVSMPSVDPNLAPAGKFRALGRTLIDECACTDSTFWHAMHVSSVSYSTPAAFVNTADYIGPGSCNETSSCWDFSDLAFADGSLGTDLMGIDKGTEGMVVCGNMFDAIPRLPKAVKAKHLALFVANQGDTVLAAFDGLLDTVVDSTSQMELFKRVSDWFSLGPIVEKMTYDALARGRRTLDRITPPGYL